MVYCTKCGTQNPDSATHCSNCGSPLYGSVAYTRQESRERYSEGYGYRRRGSGIGLIIGGVIVLVIGLAVLFDALDLLFRYLWAIIIIIIGIWLLARGLTYRSRRRPPPR